MDGRELVVVAVRVAGFGELRVRPGRPVVAGRDPALGRDDVVVVLAMELKCNGHMRHMSHEIHETQYDASLAGRA